MVMTVVGFQPTESLRVGYAATNARLHPKVVVEHLMVDNALNYILRHKTSVQSGMDPNGTRCLGICPEPDRALLPHPPVGAPGNGTVNLAVKVFTVDPLKYLA
jgi:hypothetical protein